MEAPQHTTETKPNPDPTIATNEAVERAMKSERDYVDGKVNVIEVRLNGMDTATALRLGQFEDLPSQIDEKVNHLRELTEEKFSSVKVQFVERDDRTKSEGVANEVKVNAAFAAQKEAAAEQNKSNTLAINKSEDATKEAISKLGQLVQTNLDGIATQISDLKERIGKIENMKLGGKETGDTWKWAIGFGISLMLASITIVGFIVAFKKN